ncbi:uncharacterized protein PGTG_06404 [Puccinia graminis f. sp. tritici CRL 75-36-700-3]|uniref:Uncharacterized protein n=1 Tax=Puccinia graminis f. sp. tritici (strain CRL 75-36-700-3 / race SCCL) TaxID=418459 RepID=E3K7B8_PUCGT|nr:uncharacterized protein PGTG_06404 [Puccinia graminis f. sp. tritici CRL 75-36-700-3]EFP80448.1 hypothetical protein PGTG_06404 [Puccinia graminis f. sp. tritici CRL 75-36-700-3]
MRQIRKTTQTTLVNSHHNCDRGDCQITPTKAVFLERRKSSVKGWEATHNDDENYVINAASLSAQVSHRKVSSLKVPAIQPLEWIDSLHDGLSNWGSMVVPVMGFKVPGWNNEAAKSFGFFIVD